MQIKIKLPHNVRVTCPSVESAIIILRSLSLRSEYASLADSDEIRYPNSENCRSEWGPPPASGRPTEGEAFNAYAGSASADVVFEGDSEDVDRSSELAVDDDSASGEGDGLEFRVSEFEDPEESELIDAELAEHDGEDLSKLTTRSIHSASQGANFYLPVGVGDRTRRIFEFIKDELSSFTTKEVNEFAEQVLDIKLNKKNKRKIRSSLHTLVGAGFIERTTSGRWQKVA